MRSYFDTSAFATLILRDDRWQNLDRWIEREHPLPVASDYGWGELNSAIAIRSRSTGASLDEARKTIEVGREMLLAWQIVQITSDDIRSATAFVARITLRLRLPDAIHIALAQRLHLPLVTCDHNQAAAARAIGLTVHTPLMEDAAG